MNYLNKFNLNHDTAFDEAEDRLVAFAPAFSYSYSSPQSAEGTQRERLLRAALHMILDLPLSVLFSLLALIAAAVYMYLDNETDQVKQLRLAKKLIGDVLKEKDCAPIFLRMAWHDAGTYDSRRENLGWPEAGGAIGSLRTHHEIYAPVNAGLMRAISTFLAPIKKEVPLVSWADLFQMAGACAVEASGGPVIPIRYGRVDGKPVDKAPPPFGLPDARPPYAGPDEKDPAAHLKYVFGKYNMTNKDIVALSGAHTIGRAFAERSGAVKEGLDDGTAYTKAGCPFLRHSTTPGGRSWTKNWLKFDNSYFTDMGNGDSETFSLPTDLVLKEHLDFKPYFDEFAADQKSFFVAYSASHVKLSELGAKFSPPGGIILSRRMLPTDRPLQGLPVA